MLTCLASSETLRFSKCLADGGTGVLPGREQVVADSHSSCSEKSCDGELPTSQVVFFFRIVVIIFKSYFY